MKITKYFFLLLGYPTYLIRSYLVLAKNIIAPENGPLSTGMAWLFLDVGIRFYSLIIIFSVLTDDFFGTNLYIEESLAYLFAAIAVSISAAVYGGILLNGEKHQGIENLNGEALLAFLSGLVSFGLAILMFVIVAPE